MRFLAASIAITLTACNVVSVSDEPLSRKECGNLMDKIHDIHGEGLTGAGLAEYNDSRDREFDVEECVTDPVWGRRGYECAMKATGEATLTACIHVDG